MTFLKSLQRAFSRALPTSSPGSVNKVLEENTKSANQEDPVNNALPIPPIPAPDKSLEKMVDQISQWEKYLEKRINLPDEDEEKAIAKLELTDFVDLPDMGIHLRDCSERDEQAIVGFPHYLALYMEACERAHKCQDPKPNLWLLLPLWALLYRIFDGDDPYYSTNSPFDAEKGSDKLPAASNHKEHSGLGMGLWVTQPVPTPEGKGGPLPVPDMNALPKSFPPDSTQPSCNVCLLFQKCSHNYQQFGMSNFSYPGKAIFLLVLMSYPSRALWIRIVESDKDATTFAEIIQGTTKVVDQFPLNHYSILTYAVSTGSKGLYYSLRIGSSTGSTKAGLKADSPVSSDTSDQTHLDKENLLFFHTPARVQLVFRGDESNITLNLLQGLMSVDRMREILKLIERFQTDKQVGTPDLLRFGLGNRLIEQNSGRKPDLTTTWANISIGSDNTLNLKFNYPGRVCVNFNKWQSIGPCCLSITESASSNKNQAAPGINITCHLTQYSQFKVFSFQNLDPYRFVAISEKESNMTFVLVGCMLGKDTFVFKLDIGTREEAYYFTDLIQQELKKYLERKGCYEKKCITYPFVNLNSKDSALKTQEQGPPKKVLQTELSNITLVEDTSAPTTIPDSLKAFLQQKTSESVATVQPSVPPFTIIHPQGAPYSLPHWQTSSATVRSSRQVKNLRNSPAKSGSSRKNVTVKSLVEPLPVPFPLALHVFLPTPGARRIRRPKVVRPGPHNSPDYHIHRMAFFPMSEDLKTFQGDWYSRKDKNSAS